VQYYKRKYAKYKHVEVRATSHLRLPASPRSNAHWPVRGYAHPIAYRRGVRALKRTFQPAVLSQPTCEVIGARSSWCEMTGAPPEISLRDKWCESLLTLLLSVREPSHPPLVCRCAPPHPTSPSTSRRPGASSPRPVEALSHRPSRRPSQCTSSAPGKLAAGLQTITPRRKAPGSPPFSCIGELKLKTQTVSADPAAR
jgi:hypothetical protein